MQEVIARRPLTIGYGSALLGVVLFQPQVLMLFHSRDKIQLEIDFGQPPRGDPVVMLVDDLV
jgi:hypothetical protein